MQIQLFSNDSVFFTLGLEINNWISHFQGMFNFIGHLESKHNEGYQSNGWIVSVIELMKKPRKLNEWFIKVFNLFNEQGKKTLITSLCVVEILIQCSLPYLIKRKKLIHIHCSGEVLLIHISCSLCRPNRSLPLFALQFRKEYTDFLSYKLFWNKIFFYFKL